MAYYDLQEFLSTVGSNGFQRSTHFRCRLDLTTIQNNRLASIYPSAFTALQRGLLCEATRLPSRQFETTPLSIYGYEEKYPTFTTYTDLECTFLAPLFPSSSAAGNGELRNEVHDLFTTWQALVQNPTSVQVNGAVQILDGTMNLSFPDTYRLKDGMVLETFSPFNPKRNSGQIGLAGNINVPRLGIQRAGIRFGEPSEDVPLPPTATYRMYNVYPITVESVPVSWGSVDETVRVTVTFAYSYWSSTAPTLA